MELVAAHTQHCEVFLLDLRELLNRIRETEAVLLEFDSPAGWDVLRKAVEIRRWLTAAMNILDFGPPSLAIPFLIGSPKEQAAIVASVIEAGGLYDDWQRWIECYE